jgi:uncharacterized protein YigE (DUF2233 family)
MGCHGALHNSWPRIIALHKCTWVSRSLNGTPIAFAMNAGMYEADLSPVGLYVEHGKTLKRANTARGPGNFHIQPNGVFYLSGQTAGVLTTEHFLSVHPRADFATQSGPCSLSMAKFTQEFGPV